MLQNKEMIITVFGSTGFMGRELVKQALFKHHQVRAYGRHVHTTNYTPSDRLVTIPGTLFDDKQVLNALQGADAVMLALDSAADGVDKTRSLGIKHIIAQMQNAGVTRIMAICGMGILTSETGKLIMEEPGFPPELVPIAMEDRLVYNQLGVSGLEWTIMAPPLIKEGSPTGTYFIGKDTLPSPNNYFVYSGDLALFMVNELERKNFLYSRVGISS